MRTQRQVTTVTSAEQSVHIVTRVLLPASLLLFGLPAVVPEQVGYLVIGCTLFAIVALALWAALVRRRAEAIRRQHLDIICTNCRYPLDAIEDDPGVCPECGAEFTRAATQAYWRAAYALREKRPGNGAPASED